MEFRLIRGCTMEQIVEWYSNERVDGIEPIQPRYNCNLQPSITKRGGGTLHKAEFRIKQNTAFENYSGENFHLLIQSKKRWVDNDSYPTQKNMR